MLRNIFLMLLLANVVLFAWQRWIVPPEVADPAAGAGNALPERRLVLVAPDPMSIPAPAALQPQSLPPSPPDESTAGAEASPPAGDPAQAPASVCRQVGPFDSSESAVLAAVGLRANGLEMSEISREGKVWVGHWVQVDGLVDRRAAEAAIDALIGEGIVDAYVVTTTPAYKLSLGVFRGRAGADQAMRAARRAGLQPVTVDRFRTGTEYWLQVRLAAGQVLDLDALGAQPGRILRTETVDCGDGGPADDSLE